MPSNQTGSIIMEAAISMQSRGRGAFALRKELKAAKDTTCSLKRHPTNEFGTIFVIIIEDHDI